MKIKNLLLASVCFFVLPSMTLAQTNDSISPFKVTADIVSHYVWRGLMATESPTPNFQPTLAYKKENFEVGVWGSTDFVGSYKEVDPYTSLTMKQFRITLTDYNWNFGKANYFNYNQNKTGHILEGSLGYAGPETFPISISWNTMFYGFDKKQNLSDTTIQTYSTYIELGYSKGPASFFFGFSPWESYYSAYRKGFEVVNIGLSVTKSLKITDKFSLPLKSSFIVNPSGGYTKNDYVHLVFGITL
jgi:hypothetical protein